MRFQQSCVDMSSIQAALTVRKALSQLFPQIIQRLPGAGEDELLVEA